MDLTRHSALERKTGAPLRIPGFKPMSTPDTGADVNPESSFAHAAAMRAILLYLIADAFDLNAEEVMWSGRVLDEVSGELLLHSPHSVPYAARQEMLSGTYTRLLELRESVRRARGTTIYDTHVAHATPDEWVDALMVTITSAYDMPPLTENRLRATLVTLLSDLGVGSMANPRSSTHLPTELRQRVLANRA